MRRENTWVSTWTGEQLVESKGTREATPESGQLKNDEVTADGGEESRRTKRAKPTADEKSKANSRQSRTQVYKDDRLPEWRRATHTCNDVYQLENKIKFLTAGAPRGVDSHTFDGRLNRTLWRLDMQLLNKVAELDTPAVVQRQAPMFQTVLGGFAVAVR